MVSGLALFSPVRSSGEAPGPSPSSTESMVERRPVLMGTTARIVVVGPTRQEALATTVSIEETLRSAEDELSTWKSGTALDRLNHTPVGQAVELSDRVDEELERALACAATTHGAFDPTVGALTHAWDLRGTGRRPGFEELEDARRRTGWRFLARQGDAWRRHRDLVVDEGGFGKGAALDRVGSWLAESTPRRVLVDLGGQILVVDTQTETTQTETTQTAAAPWQVAVADPDDRSLPVLYLSLPHGSVATSGNSERATGTAEDPIGHLLDPRSGKPATDFGSVTVWAPTALEADCLATGLFVAGPEAALAFAESCPHVEVLVIERQGRGLIARASAGLRQHIEDVSPRISLRFETSCETENDSMLDCEGPGSPKIPAGTGQSSGALPDNPPDAIPPRSEADIRWSDRSLAFRPLQGIRRGGGYP